MELASPASDELEVSVFGRGFGEAICVHIGDAEWVLVDSCLNPETGRPAALTYLSAIGLVPKDVVRLIAVTHWHDDHIGGIGSLARECSQALVTCSEALRRSEIFEFVINQEGAAGALGSGLDELRTILRLERNRVIWAKANLSLYPRPPGDAPAVIALSPSEDAVRRSIEALIEAATGQPITLARRYKAPEGPNGASVALSIRRDDIAVLLGADLETSSNSETGWDGVLKYSKPDVRASVVKVPHHGSQSAHHDGFWTDLAEDQVVAIVTPWVKGGRHLPTQQDLSRIRRLTKRAYLTAMPSFPRAKMDSQLQTMIRKLHADKLVELGGWGQVRARRRLTERDWRIELGGNAIAVGG